MPRKKKKVGAPPGNQNARKHGFYSKILTPEQKHVLDLAARLDVDGEVALLRMQIRSLLKTDPKNIELFLRTISQLCNVVRTRQDTASHKRRELVALARLGVPVEGDPSRPVLPVERVKPDVCPDLSRYIPTCPDLSRAKSRERSRGSKVEELVSSGVERKNNSNLKSLFRS